MGKCTCGRPTKKNSARCVRCVALHEIGLHAGASEEEIKSAYRVQVKTWHPDQYAAGTSKQRLGEEKLKRVNAAYKLLTSLSKGRGVPAPPNSTTSSEPRRPSPSSASSDSTNSNKTGSTEPQHGVRGKQEQPPKASATRGIPPRPLKQGNSHYPQPDFKKWEVEFNSLLIGGSNAAKGLKKWIRHGEAQRAANIALVENHCKSLRVDPPNLKGLPRPEDTRSDLIRRLWFDSAPNLEERTRATKADNQFLKQMEKLKDSAEALTKSLQSRRPKLLTQDRFFEIPLDPVLRNCIQLSNSIRAASALVKRTHIYPMDVADCCIELVIEMEDRSGLSKRDCHALIKCALLAHGCTPNQVAQFDEELIERGTIGAKKESLKRKLFKSADIISAIVRKS